MHPNSVAARFDLGSVQAIEPFAARGNINPECYVVTSNLGKYLLQRINTHVFADPATVIRGTQRWLDSQRRLMEAGHLPTVWRDFRLVPTLEGGHLASDATGVWRVMTLIEGVRCYRRLAEVGSRSRQLALAREVGKGIGCAAAIGSEVALEGLGCSLPGFHDTAGYYRQLEAVLRGHEDPAHNEDLFPPDVIVMAATQHLYAVRDREVTVSRFAETEAMVERILEAREETMVLQSLTRTGEVPLAAVHGDTKLENFLFDENDRVVALVDLDTVMAGTWYLDWADGVRSLANPAGEMESDLEAVVFDVEVEQAIGEGYHRVRPVGGADEQRTMRLAAISMTLEQALRFLTDYLRGDVYYRVGPNQPADLNRIRAAVQLRLADQMLEAD